MHFSSKPLSLIVAKVSARCNLNCSYCYVFNKGDSTWTTRPAVMSEPTFIATLNRIKRHCQSSGQKEVRICFHGGEPCLMGPEKFDIWCQQARKLLHGLVAVELVIQTNATLLNATWIEIFLKHQVSVGISMDGPREIHDRYRVDHKGEGSYEKVLKGVSLLCQADVPFSILSVIQMGADPIRIHRHFLDLGCKSISYLLPDFSHDTVGPVRQHLGQTPCADFLIPIFDDWWFNSTIDINIANFRNIARVIMGARSAADTLGNGPLGFLFVEADGEIEGLDVLRVCEDGLARTNLNVHEADFWEIGKTSPLHASTIFEGIQMPHSCQSCPERDTCGGGYLPHRYSRQRGFDNPSVWCADLLKLFGHIRFRMKIPVGETELRRKALEAIRPGAL
jgi:uncharacterized protein